MSNNQPPPNGNDNTPQGPDNSGEEPTRHAPRRPGQSQPGQPQQYGAAAPQPGQQPGQQPDPTRRYDGPPAGQPGQQPHGSQQPGQQPYGAQPGQQPYGSQQPGHQPYGAPGGPGQQPPKKSKTGLFAILGVVLVLIIGGAVALVLTLGGDDKDDDAKDDESSSESSEDPSEDSSEDPTDEPTDDESTDGESGAVSGTGYSYDLPSGWSDMSEEMSSQDPRVDSAIAAGSSFEQAEANILVEAGSSGGETDPEAARATLKSNISSSVGATATDVENSEIGGAEAIGVKVERTNTNGVEIVQTAYLAIQDGKVATVTISSTTDNEEDALAAFEEMSDSWQWE